MYICRGRQPFEELEIECTVVIYIVETND